MWETHTVGVYRPVLQGFLSAAVDEFGAGEGSVELPAVCRRAAVSTEKQLPALCIHHLLKHTRHTDSEEEGSKVKGLQFHWQVRFTSTVSESKHKNTQMVSTYRLQLREPRNKKHVDGPQV